MWTKILIGFTILAMLGVGLLISGCGKSSGSSTATTSQTVQVTKGNLINTVSAIGNVDMPNQAHLTFGSSGSVSNLYTITEIDVSMADQVKKGEVLAKVDTSSLQSAVAQAQANLETAQINLNQASSQTNLLKAQAAVDSATASLSSAEQDLQNAQSSSAADAQLALDNAQQSLITVQNNSDTSIRNAENSVSDTQQTYDNYVQANIDNLTRADIAAQKDRYAANLLTAQNSLKAAQAQAASSLATAQNNVTQAQAALQTAQIDLVVQQKQAAVATAKANLSQAQDNLAYVQAGHDIELLKIQVTNAQASADNAVEQLQAATILAPFDGVVAAVNASVGDQVTATKDIIDLVDTSKVLIDGSVDETDVSKVQAGQTTMITLDALPNVSLRGTVNAVSPLAQSSSNVVTYALTIAVPNISGNTLDQVKQGMTASVNIVVLNKSDVLLVPSTAIKRNGRDSVVQVVTSTGQTEQRTITIGETNGTQTEVTSGLSEGEKVLVTVSNTSSSSTSSTTRLPGGGGFFIQGGGGGDRRPGD
jgi:HlyD family secretion protein